MSRNRLESPMTALHPLLFLALFLAAAWVAGRANGLYTMFDVLDLANF